MFRYKMIIEYVGTAYIGWQIQSSSCCGSSIQARILEAFYRFCGEKVLLVAAGGTDSGVHALGQVRLMLISKEVKLLFYLLNLFPKIFMHDFLQKKECIVI
jgi:tRNA pseudouridine38-40 synthase